MLYIILLIILGALFLIAELLLLPGVSIGAIVSLVCYGSAIYIAFDDFGSAIGILVIAIEIILSSITVVVSLRAKTWQRFSLKQSIDSTGVEQPEQSVAVGSRGIALSRIAPMGKVEIGGRTYEAKSADDAYIDQRQEIEVVGFDNFSIIVRKIQ